MDDLFGGLDDLKPVAARKSKNDFMSDLFGSKSEDQNKAKEFVLDDKYKKSEDFNPPKITNPITEKTNPVPDQLEIPVSGRGRRRGNPTFGGAPTTSVAPSLDPISLKPEPSQITSTNAIQPKWLSSDSQPAQLNPALQVSSPGLAQPAPSLSQTNPAFQLANPAFPSINPSFPQVNPSFPQVNSSFPQVNPSYPQVNPVFSQVNPTFNQAIPNYSQVTPNVNPPPMVQVPYQAPPTIVYSNPALDQSMSVHNELMRQMGDFERQQQEQFQRDLEDQRRILEAKQREYKVLRIFSGFFLDIVVCFRRTCHLYYNFNFPSKSLFSYCYHLIIVISYCLTQCDHIKRRLLYLILQFYKIILLNF
jgi:hypothetical protein